MAATVQNPFGLTLIQCHAPFVLTVTDTACLAADTGRFAAIACHAPFVPTETDTACLESDTRVLQLANNHIELRTSKISGDAFRSEEILLKRLVSVPKTVKKGTLKAHIVGDIRGHEELAMDYNSPRVFGCGG
jgi:hypothetical protein